jgi:hypothetical protein
LSTKKLTKKWGQLGTGDLVDRNSLILLSAPKSFNFGVGKSPRTFYLTCDSKCTENGYCSKEDPSKCFCNPGYSGTFCNVKFCPGSDPPVFCSDHGVCANSTCICNPGYTGPTCEVPICFGKNSTDYSVCSGRGDCKSPDMCKCNDGYSGAQCSDHACSGVHFQDPSVCSGKGICVSPNTCNCTTSSYGGINCNLPYCFGKLSSDSYACGFFGTCVGPNNCSCSSVFVGPECLDVMCFGIISSNTSTCSGRGKCIYHDQCTCDSGFSGNSCQFTGQVSTGREAETIALVVGIPIASLFLVFLVFLLCFPLLIVAYKYRGFARFIGIEENLPDERNIEDPMDQNVASLEMKNIPEVKPIDPPIVREPINEAPPNDFRIGEVEDENYMI